MFWKKEKHPHIDPLQCPCQDITQVEGNKSKYWPRKDGKPTGHDPTCIHYRKPPTYEPDYRPVHKDWG